MSRKRMTLVCMCSLKALCLRFEPSPDAKIGAHQVAPLSEIHMGKSVIVGVRSSVTA